MSSAVPRSLRFAALALLSCGPSSPAVAPTPASQSQAIATTASEDWTCGGNLIPPTGWQQDTAFADSLSPNARSKASDAATAKLAARLCAGAGGTGCDFVTAHVRLWKTGTNGKEVCAMAVIRADDLQTWQNLSSTLATLDDRLGGAAKELMKGIAAGKRVAIDQVIDMGVPGGVRADWLRTRMERLLAASASIVDVPKRWAGDGVPPGVDVVIRCKVIARQEEGVPTLESQWTARFPDGRRTVSAPVTFPERAAPRAPTDVAPASSPDSPGLSVRLASHAGSLCAGDQTELWVKADAPLYIRVFDLYGAGQALLSYPGSEKASARIEAGQEVSLGKFEATPLPGFESERFLVVAASSEQALGRLAAARSECRVSAEVATQLFAGSGTPPGAKVASTGYRITSGPSCNAPTGSAERVAQAVAALPACPL